MNEKNNIIAKGVITKLSYFNVDCGLCEHNEVLDATTIAKMESRLTVLGWIKKQWKIHGGQRYIGWICPRCKHKEGW